ncbi:hypothetical protein [Corallococcus exiguus]|uniref:hypothetical protein n=1 Tax=Corallococcus exiguus TaxID=83462 RepID=UPI00345A3B5F
MRIYPVPFRRLDEEEQYKKFDWIECRLKRNSTDHRPETFRPLDESELHPIGHIGTADCWRERRRLILKTARVYSSLKDLISKAKANESSLAVFKPSRIIDFVCEEEESRIWEPSKLQAMRSLANQNDMFLDQSWRTTFEVIPKLPYSFYYRFEDSEGRSSTLKVLDWEVGALYWNCLRRADGNERAAIAKVKRKYMDEFLATDLHFFLGTLQQYHFMAPNPWVIIGVFPIPVERQGALF